MILLTKTSDQTRQKRHTLSTCTIITQTLGTLCSPPLIPCYSLDYLSWQLLDQPFIFYIFSSFHPSLPLFPHVVYNSWGVLCFFASPPPSPILPSFPFPFPSSSPFPYPLLLSFPSPLPSRSHPVFVHGFHPRPHSRSHPVPAPSPSPSPFPPPTPCSSPFPCPTPIPPPTPFAPFRPSNPVTLSV